jgi:hypothetical protein
MHGQELRGGDSHYLIIISVILTCVILRPMPLGNESHLRSRSRLQLGPRHDAMLLQDVIYVMGQGHIYVVKLAKRSRPCLSSIRR